MRPNAKVIEHDRNQPETTLSIWDYLDRAVSVDRIEKGRDAMADYAGILQEISARYDIPANVVTAIWGLESAYGTVRGDRPVIQTLATLAFEGRRASLFEPQLIAALQILQTGQVSPENLRGSWAGAMGHTQLMPISYQKYGVDFDGDGNCNIWDDDPADALASAASYLVTAGWQINQPSIFEVDLTANFDFSACDVQTTKPVRAWALAGVELGMGKLPDDSVRGSIWLPGGATGPVFMVFENFSAILRYNASRHYALAVALLAGRISGAGSLRTDWPREIGTMDLDTRREFQQLLTSTGFDTIGTDGIFGPNTFSALRKYQRAMGNVPDGFPTSELLQKLCQQDK